MHSLDILRLNMKLLSKGHSIYDLKGLLDVLEKLDQFSVQLTTCDPKQRLQEFTQDELDSYRSSLTSQWESHLGKEKEIPSKIALMVAKSVDVQSRLAALKASTHFAQYVKFSTELTFDKSIDEVFDFWESHEALPELTKNEIMKIQRECSKVFKAFPPDILSEVTMRYLISKIFQKYSESRTREDVIDYVTDVYDFCKKRSVLIQDVNLVESAFIQCYGR